MIADRGGPVSQRVVSGDDRRALIEIGLQGPLEHVAGVDEQHGSAVDGTRGTEIRDIAAEQGETAAILALEDSAVQVVRADDRERDRPRGRALGATTAAVRGPVP